MNVKLLFSFVLTGVAICAATAQAQSGCQTCQPVQAAMPCQSCQTGCQTYRIVHKTIYDQEPVTAYRMQTETVMQERQVTVEKPVWEQYIKERRYTVARPVSETSSREERFTVMKPVWETEYREDAYDQVTYETSTEIRRQETYVVSRPVVKQVDQTYMVNRPVQETVMQNQQYTAYEPQTVMQTQYVDQGQVVQNQIVTPGAVRNRLQWTAGAYYPEPVTGTPVWHRAGFHWVPIQFPGTVAIQQQYVPNIVAQQIPSTQYVAKVVNQAVPVQVTRYQQEMVTQKVNVETIEQTQEVRNCPVPVQKAVTRRVVNRVPVQVCKWVEQEEVRRVPVVTQRVEYEEKVETTPYKVLKYETETRIIQEPVTVNKWVPYQTTRYIPRTVVMRVPLDQFGNEIAMAPPATSVAPSTPSILNETIRNYRGSVQSGPSTNGSATITEDKTTIRKVPSKKEATPMPRVDSTEERYDSKGEPADQKPSLDQPSQLNKPENPTPAIRDQGDANDTSSNTKKPATSNSEDEPKVQKRVKVLDNPSEFNLNRKGGEARKSSLQNRNA